MRRHNSFVIVAVDSGSSIVLKLYRESLAYSDSKRSQKKGFRQDLENGKAYYKEQTSRERVMMLQYCTSYLESCEI